MILAEGTIAITQSPILVLDWAKYLPDTPNAKIEKITFFNTVLVAQTAILSVQARAETSREIRQFILRQFNGGEYLEPGEFLSLQSGDQILAETTTAGAVNFQIVGERV